MLKMIKSNENLIPNDAIFTEPRGKNAVAIVDLLPNLLPPGERLVVPEEIDGRLVVEIGSRAFQDCVDRKVVVVPDELSKIADDAFPLTVKIGVAPGSCACLWAKAAGRDVEVVFTPDSDSRSIASDEDDEEENKYEEFELVDDEEDDDPFPKVSPMQYWYAPPSNDEEDPFAKFESVFDNENSEDSDEGEASEEDADCDSCDDAPYAEFESVFDDKVSEDSDQREDAKEDSDCDSCDDDPYAEFECEFDGKNVDPLNVEEDEVDGEENESSDSDAVMTSLNLKKEIDSLFHDLKKEGAVESSPLSVYISADKESVNDVFLENAAVDEFRVSPDNPYYSDIDGVLFSSDKTVLIRYPNGKLNDKYVVPAGVREIADGAFDNSWLKEIVVTSDVESIGSRAFLLCPYLEAIRVEGNTIYSSIDGVLFQYGYKLVKYPQNKEDKTYVAPSEVVEIDERAFAGNCHLETVALGENVSGIGYGAFVGCLNIKEFKVDPENTNYAARNEVLFTSSLQTLIQYPPAKKDAKYVIPDEVETLEEQAFTGAKFLRFVDVPEGVREIGDGVFTFCQFLESIQVSPDNVAYASYDGALLNRCQTELIACPAAPLDGVFVVPNGVQTICEQAFTHGSQVRRIWIGDDVMEIDEETFRFTTETLAIEVSPENESFSSLDGVLFDKEQTTLVRYPEARPDAYYEVPSTVRTIKSNAFRGAANLTTIILPEGVESIESGAFENVFFLARVLIPRSVSHIADNAFDALDFAFCVYEGSCAHEWALDRDVPFALIEEDVAQ